jgi:hypothetical protein
MSSERTVEILFMGCVAFICCFDLLSILLSEVYLNGRFLQSSKITSFIHFYSFDFATNNAFPTVSSGLNLY